MQYQSLEPGEIRLLRIFPSRYHKAFIRCHLSAHALNGAAYEALSYVWGTSVSTEKIYVNEEEVTVTSNLLAALRHLRDVEEVRTLWVDAICINQSDQDEKSIQVMEMGNIYHNATTVCCWLGEEPATDAMKFIRAMSDAHTKLAQQTKGKGVLVQSSQDQNAPVLDGPHVDDMMVPFLLVPLMDFLGRQYFHRVWTVQELMLGQRVVIHCAHESADWAGFSEHFPSWLSQRTTGQGAFLGSIILKIYFFPAAGSRLKQCGEGYQRTDTSLLDTLIKYRDRDATDMRDKVYGLLSLCGHPGFEADYHKTTTQVYCDVLRYIIEKDQNLDVLSAIAPIGSSPDGRKQEQQSWLLWAQNIVKVSLTFTVSWPPAVTLKTYSQDHVLQDCASKAGLPGFQQNSRAYSLPSWAVDWGAKGGLYLFLDHVRSSSYNANSSSTPQVKLSSSDDGRLEVDGLVIDTIVAYSISAPVEKGKTVDIIFSAWNFWTSNKTGTDRYKGQENEETAFLRTVTANQATNLVCKLLLQSEKDVPSTLLMAAAKEIARLGGEEAWETSGSTTQRFSIFCSNSKFCITRSGFMGRVPLATREGDIIVVAAGGKVPLVLRPCQGQLRGSYTLVGDSCKYSCIGLLINYELTRWLTFHD